VVAAAGAVLRAAADTDRVFIHKQVMTMMKTFLSIGILLVVLTVIGYGQFPEDALRYSTPGLGVGARPLGMGTAFSSVANDFSATYWNPAGLGQIRSNEISVGFSYLSYGNTSTFFTNQQSFTNSSTNLNSIGMVYPFPTSQGSLVFALGYGRQSEYTTGLSFQGFNPTSSIIQFYSPDGQPYPSDVTLPEYLKLAYADTLNGRFISPITKDVRQSGKVLEGGGMNHVSVAAAIEATRNFYLGATLNFITGSYSYSRKYNEFDSQNLYTAATVVGGYLFDFNSLNLEETVESDLSGFTATLGLLYEFAPHSRFGLTVKTPSWVTVRETYSQSGSSLFDNGDNFSAVMADGVKNEYDVTSPFIFSMGLSHSIKDLLLAADIDYTDWTQMEFRNADQRLLSYNTDIKEIFRPTANLKIGAEYVFPDIGFRLRGGFAYIPSPYSGDPSSFAQKYITGGLGFVVENAMAIDLGYAYGYWDSYRLNYDQTSRTDENISTNTVLATVAYRF
jgi:long-subunit fatty acid transport protein